MKEFFREIFLSISSIEYYRSVLLQPLSRTVRFYALFLGLISLVLTAEYWLKSVPFWNQTLQMTAQEITSNYPSDTVMTWNNDKLTISNPPVYIPYPTALPSPTDDRVPNLAVITDAEELPASNTLLVITPTTMHLIAKGESVNQVSLQRILGSDPLVLTKSTIGLLTDTLLTHALATVRLVGYFFPVLAWIALIISRLSVLLFESVMLVLLFRLLQIRMSYGKLLQLSMHIFVPAEIIQQVSRISGVEPAFSMLSLAFWVLFTVIFFSIRRRPAGHT